MIWIVCDVKGSASRPSIKLRMAGIDTEDKWVSANEAVMYVKTRGRSARGTGIRYNGGNHTKYLSENDIVEIRSLHAPTVRRRSESAFTGWQFSRHSVLPDSYGVYSDLASHVHRYFRRVLFESTPQDPHRICSYALETARSTMQDSGAVR